MDELEPNVEPEVPEAAKVTEVEKAQDSVGVEFSKVIPNTPTAPPIMPDYIQKAAVAVPPPHQLPKGWNLPGALLVALDEELGNDDLNKTAETALVNLNKIKAETGLEDQDVAFAEMIGEVQDGKVTQEGYKFLGDVYGRYGELL